MANSGGNPSLGRLPSRKTVFSGVIVAVVMLTLVLVHLSGQWVGYSMAINSQVTTKHRLSMGSHWQHGRNDGWNTDIGAALTNVTETGYDGVYTNGTTSADIGRAPSSHNIPMKVLKQDKVSSIFSHWAQRETEAAGSKLTDRTRTGVEEEIRKATQNVAPTESEHNVFKWNDHDPLSYKSLPLHNKTGREWKKTEAIIFNRVGKCGSRNVIELLRKLAALNNFNFISSVIYNNSKIPVPWQEYIVRSLDLVQTPYLFQRHLHFVDFTSFGMRQPMYINIIRDPLARFVSSYYFKRFGDGKSERAFKGNYVDLHRSVTACIMESYHECSPAITSHYIIPFFCGQTKECRKPSQWALDIAKANVEKHFVVVGILEDLENTFRVFEKELPQYFNGVVNLFLEPDDELIGKNSVTVTKRKEKPSPEAEAVMKEAMRYEYEFYYFVRQRLEQQKRHHGIVGKT